MKDALVALVRQSILTVLDEANPRTPGLAWDFNDDEQRVDFADRVAAFLPSAPVSEKRGWISVEESLPCDALPAGYWSDPMLVRFDSGPCDVRGCIRYSNGSVSWGLPPGVTAKVTHWTHLPEAPK